MGRVVATRRLSSCGPALLLLALGAALAAATDSRGMLLCTGGKMVKDAMAMIYQVHEIWKLDMAISIVHCGELNDDTQKQFRAKNASILNICDGTDNLADYRRLRGWFCKTAALVRSPYNESLVVDLDVVWFKSPDVIFNSSAYQRTGSLFFRDKTSFACGAGPCVKRTKEEKTFQEVIQDFIMHSSAGKINITESLARHKSTSDGHSFFWRNSINGSAPALNNFQDSSVIALDRNRHPRMLQVLRQLLPSFSVGYGDKEIYWLAATIAEEPFSFEPFLCGQYGDCGLLMHFDPNDADRDHENAQPLYINGEWILEKIHILGHDLEFEHPKPILVHEGLQLVDTGATRGCLCRVYGCKPMPVEVNTLLIRMQWERLTRNMGRQGPAVDCLPIFKSTAGIISTVAESFVRENKCPNFGCVDVPVYVNESINWFSDSFCDPTYFTPSAPPDIKSLEKRAQLPPPMPVITEGELIRPGSSKTVYLVVNGTLRAFPNFHTFIVTGRDFSEVQVLPDWLFGHPGTLPIGPELPPK